MIDKDNMISKEDCKETVDHPSHYAGNTSLECIEVMKVIFGNEAVYNFCLCNAFKYLWRFKNKNGGEDIHKARWYLDYVLRYIERDREMISASVQAKYYLLNDLLIDITDRIANGGI